jgi:CPA2 family monovalent cation:H+ antiporter-2
MQQTELILTLVGGLSAALVHGYVNSGSASRRLSATSSRASPSDPTHQASSPTASIAEQLAEIGVILLMFGVGLGGQGGRLRRWST